MSPSRRSTDADFVKRYMWKLLIVLGTIISFVWAASAFNTTVKADIKAIERVTVRHESDISEIRKAIKETAQVVELQTRNMVEVQTHFKYIRQKLENNSSN